MKIIVLCLCVLFGSVGSVFALPVTFDFSTADYSNKYFDALHFEIDSFVLDVESKLLNAAVTQKIGGLGVSSDGDKDATIDGSVGFDTLNFLFADAVRLLQINFEYFELNDQFSLVVDQGPLFSSDIPLVGGVFGLDLCGREFVFGVTDANDDYRIKSITVDVPTPTPEPSTWLLLSSGLLGLAFWRRKSTV